MIVTPNLGIHIGINEVEVILGIQRTATTIPHMFLLPKRGGDLAGGSDESWIGDVDHGKEAR